MPLLDAKAYRDHEFKRGEDHLATERATMADGTSVTIEHAGCADVKGWTVQFVWRGAVPASLRDEALRRLREVRAAKDESTIDEIVKMVEAIPKKSKGPYEVCLDDSRPVDGACGFEQGGRLSLSAEKASGGTALTISLFHNL